MPAAAQAEKARKRIAFSFQRLKGQSRSRAKIATRDQGGSTPVFHSDHRLPRGLDRGQELPGSRRHFPLLTLVLVIVAEEVKQTVGQ